MGQFADERKQKIPFRSYNKKEIPEKAAILLDRLEKLGICNHKVNVNNQISIPLHEQNLTQIERLHKNNAGSDHEESINRALSDWMFQTFEHKLVSLSTHKANGKEWYCLTPIG